MAACSNYDEHQFRKKVCCTCFKKEEEHPPISSDPHVWSVSDVVRWLNKPDLWNAEFIQIFKRHAVDGQMLLDNTFINTLQRFISSRQDWSRFADYRSKLLDTIQTTTEPTCNNNPKVDISFDQDGTSCTNISKESMKDSSAQNDNQDISNVDEQYLNGTAQSYKNPEEVSRITQETFTTPSYSTIPNKEPVLNTGDQSPNNKTRGKYDPLRRVSVIEQVSQKVHRIMVSRDDYCPTVVNQVIERLEFNIVLVGSPRVGKSQLINALCGGKKLAQTSSSLNSCTKKIERYVLETDKTQTPDLPACKVNFYDTPGIESWVDDAGKQRMLELIEETDPVCVIYCASPGCFADLSQLRPVLNKCKEKRVVCALVCTNMWFGNRQGDVIREFENELFQTFGSRDDKYSDQPHPLKPHKVTFFGDAALCTMVNSVEYSDLNWSTESKPVQGVDELIHGVMELLNEEKLQGWCTVVLNRRSYWEKIHDKANGFFRSRLADVQKIKFESVVSVGMLVAKVAFKLYFR